MTAAHAVATARSTRRACNKAAPAAPSAGMRRVLAKPGSGALASTATATGSFIAISLRELFRIGTEEIGEPQPPHQDHRVEHAMLFPAPSGGGDALAQAHRLADALGAVADRAVFHQLRWGRLQGGWSRSAGIGGRRPDAWNAARRTNMAWSQVAIPVSRERMFMSEAMTSSRGERPSILTSKRPQARPDRSRPLSTTRSASAGRRVSA